MTFKIFVFSIIESFIKKRKRGAEKMEGISILSIVQANQANIPMLEAFRGLPGMSQIMPFILWKPLLALLLVPGFLGLTLVILLMVWIERKLTARIQWRVGPREVFKYLGGLIQPLADGMRYFFQETIVHKDAHRPYFLQFPILAFIPVLLPLLFISAGELVAIRTDFGVQIAVALISLIPIVILGFGWASNSRLAFIGTVREAFMYFAYEIPFIICVIAMLILYGTGDTVSIVNMQSVPGAILNPVAAFAFAIAMVMATSRLPFEIPEADQELAFGPMVEYSGIVFGLVMTLAYEKAYVMAALMTDLFFMGGSGPEIPMLGDLSGAIWFFIKVLIIIVVVFSLRAIYPRYRIDQALRIGWTFSLALSLLALVISLCLVAFGIAPSVTAAEVVAP